MRRQVVPGAMPKMTRHQRAAHEASKIETHRAAAVESVEKFLWNLDRKEWDTLLKISHVPQGTRFTLEDAMMSPAYRKLISMVERKGLQVFVFERWSKGKWAGRKPTYYLAYARPGIDTSTLHR